MTTQHSTITRVTGPLVEADGMRDAKMYEVVFVGTERLMGEVIQLHGDRASIQVYEETAGIGPGQTVERTGRTMSAALAPGLLTSIYDGVQRPLSAIQEQSGSHYIARGIMADALDRKRRWEFTPTVTKGETVRAGDVLGMVQETTLIEHKVMVPPHITQATVEMIASAGEYTIEDTIAQLRSDEGNEEEVAMLQYWPIRVPRPVHGKIFPKEPLVTGGRSIDTFFPIAKGGAGCIPGPFGAGKTVTQQSLAKYCDAQVIVYVGCGERGNEMTEVLDEFPHLKDPNTGEPLMKRTVLIANTSNMPVAAREASIYTGITIAEYYRDMGYSVALMADSTSRWAEAMREISGRLEEMPGEEGYPAYLSSRTAEFYERAGMVTCLGSEQRTGALTVIGAVSPPGGDLSEPVTQSTLRVTKCFWGLDSALAYKKHFPSINWLTSYSLYAENFTQYWREHLGEDFVQLRADALEVLQREAKLMEIVRLVGMEALSNEEKLTLEVARALREDFLFQNAFDPDDAYTPPQKQYEILKSIMTLLYAGREVVTGEDFDFSAVRALDSVKKIPQLKDFSGDDLARQYEEFRTQLRAELAQLKQ